MMKSDQEIDKALEEEFSGYLKSISKEIIKPIREEAKQHKLQVDRITTSIEETGSRVNTLLIEHSDQLSSKNQVLLAALDSIRFDFRQIVDGVASENEVTRKRLMAEAKAITLAVTEGVREIERIRHENREALEKAIVSFNEKAEPLIGKAGKGVELTMMTSVRSAELKLQGVIEKSVADSLESLRAPLSHVRRVLIWIGLVLILHLSLICMLWLYR